MLPTSSPRQSNHFDVIVVGLGAMGSASAYHAANAGMRVLGLDQFSPPHTQGSSHGETRITRLAIGEGEAYTPLAIRSHELWRDLERELKVKVLHSVGGLVIGTPGTEQRFHNKPGFLQTTISAARAYNIKHELLSANDMKKRFPQFALQENEAAYYEYEAGYLNPEECVFSQLVLAKRRGADIRTNEKVLSITRTSQGGVEVRTEHGTYYAEQIVVTAGPWVQKLFPNRLPTVRITRQTLHWFSTGAHHEMHTPDRCPVFIWSFNDEPAAGIYGFPAIDGPTGGLKVASESYDRTVDPDAVHREVSATDIDSFYQTSIREKLPYLSNTCVKTTTCLYTITPDSDFAIGRLPDFPQCLAVSTCSGHGFKHSAAIGESVAQLLRADITVIPLSSFPLSRLLT